MLQKISKHAEKKTTVETVAVSTQNLHLKVTPNQICSFAFGCKQGGNTD